jgi:hypothetical protein
MKMEKKLQKSQTAYNENNQEYDIVQASNESNVADKKGILYDAETNNDSNVYDASKEGKVELVASVFLTDITDLVNTMLVYGQIDHNKRLLNIRFTDTRDYEVFVKLLKEKEEERCNPFKFLFKKPRSIFMYITASANDSSRNYKFEFTGCRIKNVSDSEYASKARVPFEDPSYHNCGVTFKYKKLIIS